MASLSDWEVGPFGCAGRMAAGCAGCMAAGCAGCMAAGCADHMAAGCADHMAGCLALDAAVRSYYHRRPHTDFPGTLLGPSGPSVPHGGNVPHGGASCKQSKDIYISACM
eukprot:267026-Prorocentrum_minimum.AAC.1